MGTIGVNWGGGGPNMAGAGASLGEALAGAIGGGNSAKAELAAAKNAAYIESLNRHNKLYDAQTALTQQKITSDANEAAIKADDNMRVAQQADRAQQAAMSESLAQEQRMGLKPPPGIGVLAPTAPAIVEYSTPANAIRDRIAYTYGNGDGAPASRADAANTVVGGAMVQQGSPEDYQRGNAMMGKPLDANDVVPGAPAGATSPDKAIFNKDKTMQLVPDPANPGRYKQVPVGGIAAGSNNQEAIDAVNRANAAYKNLADHGGVGPIVGSDYGRMAGHLLSTDNSKLRDEYEAARNKLILMERQRLMRGQGAVSDFDAKQIENMFPKFDSTDPQVGIRTLNEMQKRLTAGQSLYSPTGQDSSGPQPGDVEDGHVFLGGDPADPASWRAQ